MNHLANTRAQLLAAIEGLSETELTTLPVSGTWSLREVLAHIGGWAAWDLGAIRAIQQGKRPDLSVIQEVDAFNDRLVAERKKWSVGKILAEMEDSQAAIQELVGSLSDRDLFENGPFRGPYWENLAEWLQVAWQHEEEHIAQIQISAQAVGHLKQWCLQKPGGGRFWANIALLVMLDSTVAAVRSLGPPAATLRLLPWPSWLAYASAWCSWAPVAQLQRLYLLPALLRPRPALPTVRR